MKNTLLFFSLGLLLLAVSCGPAAEDREMMHKRAKSFQDSIANIIRASMDEAANQTFVASPAPNNVTANPTGNPTK